MNSTPLVSVLMVSYNNGKYLKEAINSILNQTYKNIELIFINDGSNDDTVDILNTFKDNRLKIYHNTEKKGIAYSRNRTLELAKGDYFAIADADDIYDRKRIEKQIQIFKRSKKHEIDIIVSDLYHITEDEGKIIKRVKVPHKNNYIKYNFLWENPLSHSTTMITKEKALLSNGYDEYLDSAIDTEWFARLSKNCNFYVIPEPLHYYRIHSNSITHNRDPEKELARSLISHTLMAEYFDGNINKEDGLVLKNILTGYDKIEASNISRAINLLNRFLIISDEKETKDTIKWGKKKISKAILNQSIYHSYTSPKISKKLVKKAFLLNPSLIFDLKYYKQITRIIYADIKSTNG